MSKLLTNQISNYNDNGPVEAKEGLNVANGKPFQVNGANGTSGDYLKSTGSSIEWSTFPSIPAAQVNVDWNSNSGVTQILNKPTLATVATTGSYNDLINLPTIPAAQLQSDWNQSNSGSLDFIKNKPTIFSGNYSDLSGRPSIPATISDLSDVNLSNPVPDGSGIKWDSSTNRWVSGTFAGGGGVTVDFQNNTVAGTNAGDSFTGTDATNNTLFGYNAGTAITEGDKSTAVGCFALESLTTGSWNTAVGQGALKGITDQGTNTAVGRNAGMSSNGSANTFIGDTCGDYSGGSNNVIIGKSAGRFNNNSNNIIIGANANGSATTVTNEITLGDTNITKFRIPGINFTIKDSTATENYVLTVDANGEAGWAAASGGGGSGATVTTADAAPTTPSDGDLWWKSDEGRLKVYYEDADSSQWVDASPPLAATGGATVTTSDSAPSSPSDGDLWWKSDEGRLKVYYDDANSSQWVDANPPLQSTSINNGTTNGTNSISTTTSTSGANANAIEIKTDNGTTSANRWRFVPNGHLIPFANAQYDIGNAEYKVRHMFLSDNTMYFEGDFLKVAQHNSGGSAQSPSYLIPLAKLKDALNASANYEAFKAAILAITDAS